jgi:hypothetical protein
MQGWDDLYLNPINEPGFLDKAKEAHALEAEAKVEEQKRVRDEALARHVLLTGAVTGFQEPAAAQQGLVEVHSAVWPLTRLSHVGTRNKYQLLRTSQARTRVVRNGLVV